MKTPELQKDIATQYKLEQSGEIDKIIHLKLRHTQSQIPRMHGNPKIHKPRIIQYRNCWQHSSRHEECWQIHLTDPEAVH